MSIRERKPVYLDEQAPTKKLCTEGDILLKKLVDKQTDKHTTLASELNKPDKFISVFNLETLTNRQSGTTSLHEVQKINEQLEDYEILRSAGLSDEDIKLYSEYKLGEETFKDLHKNMDINILSAQIKSIKEMIQIYHNRKEQLQMDSNNTRDNILLLEKPDSIETRLLKFALQNENKTCERIPHPMDDIKQIDCNLFSYLNDDVNVDQIRKRCRKYNNNINKLQEEIDSIQMNKFVNNCTKPSHRKTKWDDKLVDNKCYSTKIFTCKPENLYTIENGEIIKITNEKSEKIDLSSNKLSTDEIKLLPKYNNYTVGIPSVVIYLQNLPKDLKINELQTIFQRYNKDVTYRLMNGRMKGRAFITFKDVLTASQAMNEINGRFLKGNPIIAEYGKQPNSD